MTTKATKDKQELATEEAKKGEIIFIPFGEKLEITLTVGTVKSFIAARTAKGVLPTDAEIVKFMMLCQARQLNPWVGDAYLVGYDGRDGATFSLITAKQALDKRAELHPQYNGIESGLILLISKDEIKKREGAFCLDSEKIVGAWAKVHRKDIDRPYYYEVKLSTYDTGRSRWGKDPAGMIVKVAEAGALRKAFPTQIGGLYCGEEMEAKERNITPSGIKQAGTDLLESKSEPAPPTEAEPVEAEVVEQAEAKPAGRFKAEIVENIKENLMPPNEVTNVELTAYCANEGFAIAKGKSWDSLPASTLEKIENGWEIIDVSIQDGRPQS